MATRPSVIQVFEIAPETAPGVEASPSRLLRALTWTLTPQSEIDELRASGSKHITMTAQNREWTTGSIGGEPDYNEITYLLASVISKGTVTTVGTDTYEWEFEPESYAMDEFQTYTARRGDANHAEKIAGLIVDGFTIDVTRQDASVSGSFIAGRLNDGTAVSGTAVYVSDLQRPILPSHWNVYLDTTPGNIGNTQLLRDFAFSFNISGRHTPVWPLNNSLDSFAFTTEGPPDVGATLQMMADGTATGLLSQMRTGQTVYVRAQATGGTTAAGTISYSITFDLPLQVISAPSESDLDDLFVWEWQFRSVHDATLSNAYKVTVVNALDEL
jgi:hypothetical protein